MPTKALDFRLEFPFSMMVAASSAGGKTYFTLQLLHNKSRIFKEEVHKIIYCYGEYQKAFDEYKETHDDIIFTQDLFDVEKYYVTGKNYIVVIDDKLLEIESKTEVQSYLTSFFTQKAHHDHLCPILLTQQLFSKSLRTISLNTRYLVLFRHIRDKVQIQVLNRQFLPGSPGFLSWALDDACKVPYGFILLDFVPTTLDDFRIRNFILPTENMKIYISNNVHMSNR